MLFLGAFWCGVCQRMDESSFSDDKVIALLNAHFIPVRVEDAQRPDIDVRYNQNGWPTIAFLTPQGDHLLSVNYMAPPQFKELLARVHHLYRERGVEIQETAARVRDEAARRGASAGSSAEVTDSIVSEISGTVLGLVDGSYGGYGQDSKFPHSEATEFLLYRYETTGDPFFLSRVVLTLDNVREGRVHDGGKGGFFRYSSKRDWSEPHREKRLVDQAGLLRNYLQASRYADTV